MRILCFGKDGLLSSELQHWLPELSAEALIFLGHSDCDITNPDQVNSAFETYRPSVVINAVAYTAVDQCEDNEAEALSINATALNTIVAASNRYSATLIHFSTDYVFDGQKQGPYDEDDVVNPINAYGRTKQMGDSIVINGAKQFYILRVQWVFGPAKPNFIETMVNLSQQNDEVSVVSDQIGSPTSTTSISKAVVNLLHNMPAFGLYHFRTLNHCSWYDYACFIFETLELDIKVNPVASTQFNSKAKRPKNSVLNIAKWIYTDLYTPLSWKVDVANYLKINRRKNNAIR
ncbi:MAG: dTDP-4-dehydrorhamnose reductase [Candidatus Margulisiibacteriota bacterium]